MRLRHSTAAALGALVLVLTLPTPAGAATGSFSYVYSGLDGRPQQAALTDPPSGECITLPEVADPSSSAPASTPRNDTDAVAVVFTEPDCTGHSFPLRPYGGHASDRLKLRSVVFG
ncbi:hypothetical protein ACWGI8_27840 [Streptomyces sp. NPDC054841]